MLSGKGQSGCISQGKGTGSKGGRERSGDEGKGCQSWAIGTKSFLESHRCQNLGPGDKPFLESCRGMRVLMKKAASIELDQAVSAHVEAQRANADAIISNSFLSVWEAAQWIHTCEFDLAGLAFM